MHSQYKTSEFLIPGKTSPSHPVACVILNWQLPSISPIIWQHASIHICADGGANRLYDEMPQFLPGHHYDTRTHHLPQLICGDLDSLRPDVERYYSRCGVEIIDQSSDQDSTDFEKCIKMLQTLDTWKEKSREGEPWTIVALGAQGGRLDHILSNINTLHAYRDLDIVLCGDGNLTRLLKSGRTIIRPYRDVEGPQCGVIPLQGLVSVSSSGLKWNMTDAELRIGGLISSCNTIESDDVVIECTGDLVWTTELHS